MLQSHRSDKLQSACFLISKQTAQASREMRQSNRSKNPASAPRKKAESFITGEPGSHAAGIQPDPGKKKSFADNKSLHVETRSDAFKDVTDAEIGNTALIRCRNLERVAGFRRFYLKFEGQNPTGTQKDRIAFAQVQDALRKNFETVTLATCGNYGAAMAFACSMAGLRCIIHIPETYHTARTREMTDLGAELVRVSGDYEKSVEISRAFAAERDCYDANPGDMNTALQLRAYQEIAFEIHDALQNAPGYVAVPVSNGTTLAGIYQGFLSLYRKGKTSRIPKMVAGSSYGKNPVISAFQKKLARCADLGPDQIRETPVNEPLINWHSLDGNQALDSIRRSCGWGGYASDQSMLRFARLMRDKEGLNVLPASTAGLIAFLDLHTKRRLPSGCCVIVITGRK